MPLLRKLKALVLAVLGFRPLSTTLFVFGVYLAILAALVVTDELAKPPPDGVGEGTQNGLDLSEAYEDLRRITTNPHPYNSHSNLAVHNYILDRVNGIAALYPSFVQVEDDRTSNGSWAGGAYGVYFEGENILIKIDGLDTEKKSISMLKSNSDNDSERNGVLFSAHYDSVSAAPGATDDAMGVVTLLQLIKYFSENRQPRTAVFNINNGEEDWLNGAHAFLEHPWVNLTSVFVNLEGAAAGGRPILFRTTSFSPSSSSKSSSTTSFSSDAFKRIYTNRTLVPRPHANVLTADAFRRGFIRSGTDFEVYAGSNGEMQGFDIAFYKSRSRYHTLFDSVRYTLGGQRALWAMMEVARGVGVGVLSESTSHQELGMRENEKSEEEAPVYFDLFKTYLFTMPLPTLLTINILLLVLGPSLVILLGVCVGIGKRRVIKAASEVEKEFQHYLDGVGAEDENRGLGEGTQNSTWRPARAPTPPPLHSQQEDEEEDTGNGWFGGLFKRRSPPIHLPDSDSEDEDEERPLITGHHTSTPQTPTHPPVARRRIHKRRTGRFAVKFKHVMEVLWRHLRFWIALTVTGGITTLVVWLYVRVQPFAIYGAPYVVFFSFLSATYLALVYTLTFPDWLPFYHPSSSSSPVDHHASGHRVAFSSRPAITATYSHTSPHLKSKAKVLYHLTAARLALTSPSSNKLTLYIHLYIFTLILLVISTLGITQLDPGVAGGCIFTIWNFSVLLAIVAPWISVLGGEAMGGVLVGRWEIKRAKDEVKRAKEGAGDDDTERTPAVDTGIQHQHPDSEKDGQDHQESLLTLLHIPQLLLALPLPVLLIAQTAMVVLDGMNNTLADGADPRGVYSIVGVLAIGVVLGVVGAVDGMFGSTTSHSSPSTSNSPHSVLLGAKARRGAHKVFHATSFLVFLVWISTTLYALLRFPFDAGTSGDPLKVYFQQTVVLGEGVVKVIGPPVENTNGSSKVDATIIANETYPKLISHLSGPKLYLEHSVLPSLPSFRAATSRAEIGGTKGVNCTDDSARRGLVRCDWESGARLVPVVGDIDAYDSSALPSLSNPSIYSSVLSNTAWGPNEYFRASVNRTGPSTGRIWVKGRNTRNCRVYFDNKPVFGYAVLGLVWEDGDLVLKPKPMQRGYEVPAAGIKEIRLWSRTWEKEFIVDVDWGFSTTPATGLQAQHAPGASRPFGNIGVDYDEDGSTGIRGRIACEWNEYESGMIDAGFAPSSSSDGTRANTMARKSKGKIPAYEEVLAYLPSWAVPTKWSDGLVEAYAPFEL